ncbi:MAG: sialidase family protein [Promethearchaeota archaeon]
MIKIYDIFEPKKCGNNSHGSTITELPNNKIMAVWYCGSFEKAADVGIFASIFDRNKAEWTEPVLIEKESDKKSEGNPVIFYDDLNDRLWLFWATMDRAEYKRMPGGWSTCKLKCKHLDHPDPNNESHSPLNKDNWSEFRYLTKTWGKMTRNKPIRLSNGDVLLPIYSEWLGYKANFLICSSDSFSQGALKSKWKKIGPVKGNILQPSVVELDNGHLLAYCRTATHGKHKGHIAKTESFDYGRHWTKSTSINLPNPNSGCDMVKLKNGHLALAFNNSPKLRSPLSIAISEDNGKSWPYIKDLERDDKERFSYPSIIQAHDGTIYCSYTNKRGINIRCAEFDEEWVKSD